MNFQHLIDSIQLALDTLDTSNKNENSMIQLGPIEKPLKWSGDNVNNYFDALNNFVKINKSFTTDFSQKYLEKFFIRLLVDLRDSNYVTVEVLKLHLKKLTDMPIKKYFVIRELYGTMYQTANPLSLGPFTIFNKNIHHEHIFNKFPYSREQVENMMDFKQPICISTEVSAKEEGKAIELADIFFDKFESICSFILEGMGGNKKSIGVFNYDNYRVNHCVVINETNIHSNMTSSGAIDQVNLKTIKLDNEISGYDRLWEWLGNDKLTDIQSRIINAIIWTGKANKEKDLSIAFIQYIIALESLLQYQKKNELVSPSITSRMAELTAFIIGQDLEERIETENRVKKLYALRSGIAHGTTVKVSNGDISEAWWLLYRLIHILLNKDEFKYFQTIEDLNSWVKNKRYS